MSFSQPNTDKLKDRNKNRKERTPRQQHEEDLSWQTVTQRAESLIRLQSVARQRQAVREVEGKKKQNYHKKKKKSPEDESSSGTSAPPPPERSRATGNVQQKENPSKSRRNTVTATRVLSPPPPLMSGAAWASASSAGNHTTTDKKNSSSNNSGKERNKSKTRTARKQSSCSGHLDVLSATTPSPHRHQGGRLSQIVYTTAATPTWNSKGLAPFGELPALSPSPSKQRRDTMMGASSSFGMSNNSLGRFPAGLTSPTTSSTTTTTTPNLAATTSPSASPPPPPPPPPLLPMIKVANHSAEFHNEVNLRLLKQYVAPRQKDPAYRYGSSTNDSQVVLQLVEFSQTDSTLTLPPGTSITEEVTVLLLGLVASHPNLEVLTLARCIFPNDSIFTRMILAIKSSPNLKKINLEGAEISPQAWVKRLSEAVANRVADRQVRRDFKKKQQKRRRIENEGSVETRRMLARVRKEFEMAAMSEMADTDTEAHNEFRALQRLADHDLAKIRRKFALQAFHTRSQEQQQGLQVAEDTGRRKLITRWLRGASLLSSRKSTTPTPSYLLLLMEKGERIERLAIEACFNDTLFLLGESYVSEAYPWPLPPGVAPSAKKSPKAAAAAAGGLPGSSTLRKNGSFRKLASSSPKSVRAQQLRVKEEEDAIAHDAVFPPRTVAAMRAYQIEFGAFKALSGSIYRALTFMLGEQTKQRQLYTQEKAQHRYGGQRVVAGGNASGGSSGGVGSGISGESLKKSSSRGRDTQKGTSGGGTTSPGAATSMATQEVVDDDHLPPRRRQSFVPLKSQRNLLLKQSSAAITAGASPSAAAGAVVGQRPTGGKSHQVEEGEEEGRPLRNKNATTTLSFSGIHRTQSFTGTIDGEEDE